MRGAIGVHQGCVGIQEGEGGYRGMHVVIVGREWAWLVLGLRMVLLHHTRHDTFVQSHSSTHVSTCVVQCAPPSSPAHAPALAPYDTIYTITG
jgi:hypothetical protein